MLPAELKTASFDRYPPEARKLAKEYLSTFQRLPLSFLPSLLRELAEYDFKFPAERESLKKELETLSSLSAAQTNTWLAGFFQVRISSQLERSDWAGSPAQYVEQLSAHLWTTHQLDAWTKASVAYADRLHASVPPEPPVVPRLGITVIGQGVASYDSPLFRKLRPHGAYFSRVRPENGLQVLLDEAATRAKAHPAAYGHWYIDGGRDAQHDPALTSVSYARLEPVRQAVLGKMRREVGRPGMGPEALRTILAQTRPGELGVEHAGDPVLDRFQIKVLTEGSGTQVFSTTFAQWAARETLRRAQPLTLLVRFAPRQRQKPLNELLAISPENAESDPVGSLVDGDMGAYYNWINLQRLPGAEKTSYLAWFEDHGEAVVIGPSVPRGTESSSPTDMRQLLSWFS